MSDRRFAIRRPEEGWVVLALVAALGLILAWAVDDPAWVNGRGALTDCLSVCARCWAWPSGFIGPKVGWGRWTTHGIGALFAALLIPILAGWAMEPGSGDRGGVPDHRRRVRRRLPRPRLAEPAAHRPGGPLHPGARRASCGGRCSSRPTRSSGIGGRCSAVVIVGLVLLVNMALTARDQLTYLIAFTAVVAVPADRDARLRRAGDLAPAADRRPVPDLGAVPARRGRVHPRRDGGLPAAHPAGRVGAAGRRLGRDRRPAHPHRARTWAGCSRSAARSGVAEGSRSAPRRGSRTAGSATRRSRSRRRSRPRPRACAGGPPRTTRSPSRRGSRPRRRSRRCRCRPARCSSAGRRRTRSPSTRSRPRSRSGRTPTTTRCSSPTGRRRPSTARRTCCCSATTAGSRASTCPGGTGEYTVNASILRPFEEEAITGNMLRAASEEYPVDIAARYTDVPEGAIGPGRDGAARDAPGGLAVRGPVRPGGHDAGVPELGPLPVHDRPHGRRVRRRPARSSASRGHDQGYCLHYASTMAILLRAANPDNPIPTRLVQGFLPGRPLRARPRRSATGAPTPGSRSTSRATAGSRSTRRAAASAGPRRSPPARWSRPPPRRRRAATRARRTRIPAVASACRPASRRPPHGTRAARRTGPSSSCSPCCWPWWSSPSRSPPGRAARGARSARSPPGRRSRGPPRGSGSARDPRRPSTSTRPRSGSSCPWREKDLHTVAEAKVETAYAGARLGGARLDAVRDATRRLRISMLRLALRRPRRRRRH